MCEHITRAFNEGKRQMYQCLTLFVYPNSDRAMRMRSRVLCYECKDTNWTLLACTACPHVACTRCFKKHSNSQKHFIGMLLINGATRCMLCDDVVYNSVIEEYVIHLKYNSVASRNFHPVELISGKNVNFLKSVRPKVMSSMAGYRGLVNMGNSCYMNVIIQAIVHTPVLGRYLMSGIHTCPSPEASLECLTCELSRLSQEMYSDTLEPIAPARFLMLVWKCLGFATPNTMQDAHELYISLVERMHTDLYKNRGAESWPVNANCPCVVDAVFAGEWLSTRQCAHCNEQSSRTEFYRDLAIDLSGLRGSHPNTQLLSADEMADLSLDDASVQNTDLEFPMGSVNEPESDTLNDCLNWFMRRENITFSCEKCHSKQCYKQFTPWRPPCVLVIHLKRFENVLDKPKRHVNNIYVSFTQEISLRGTKYALYCAVVHTGSNNGKNSCGHYYCYVRGPQCWLRMNDDEVTRVSRETVFSSNAYLLFYQRVQG